MKTYSLNRSVFSKVRRRTTWLLGLGVLLGGTAAFWPLFVKAWREPEIRIVAMIPIVCGVPIGVGIVALLTNLGAKQQQMVWEAFQIELGEDYIALRQLRVPEVRIRREEVTQLQENIGGLRLFTSDRNRSIWIPEAVEDYPDLKKVLSSWAPFHPKPRYAQLSNLALWIGSLLGLMIILVSSNPWLVLLIGICLVGFYSFFYWSYRHQVSMDPQTKRILLIGVVMILLVSGFRLWSLTR
jgi:hypothetical protein